MTSLIAPNKTYLYVVQICSTFSINQNGTQWSSISQNKSEQNSMQQNDTMQADQHSAERHSVE
jgi:hypothetical protein